MVTQDKIKIGIKVLRLDHLVLTVSDIEATEAFYRRVMGMTPVVFGRGRHALAFGNQKINLHQTGSEFPLRASKPLPGSADLCFLIETPLDEAIQHLEREGISLVEGPVQKTGAKGLLMSIYFRDPDGNLIELSNEVGAS
jgi:catechol 2,3-dioxygenase-like lactoylglutathione lyase family enzyme